MIYHRKSNLLSDDRKQRGVALGCCAGTDATDMLSLPHPSEPIRVLAMCGDAWSRDYGADTNQHIPVTCTGRPTAND